jgi:hypothetical protein
MKQMFKDAQVQADFDANGYVKLPWLNAANVEALRALYQRLAVKAPDGFSFSMASPDSELRFAVRQGIVEVFEPQLQSTFVDALALQGSFLTKTRGDGKAEYVSAHQDWTFVDETDGDVSINIWCPLEETSERNGNLYVVPKSNRLPRYPRVAEPCKTPYQAYYDLLKQVAVAVPTSLGEAVVFDNATVHFSSRNQTDSLRLVAGVMVVRHSSKPVLYYQNADDASMLDEYRSSIEYFIQRPFGTRPDTFLRSIPKTIIPDAEGEVRRLYPALAKAGAETSQAPTSFPRRVLKRLFG